MAPLLTLYKPWSHQGKVQAHLLIQVKTPVINPQDYHLKPHQWSLLTILALFQHMYQVRVRKELQVLREVLYHPRSLVKYLHWHQAQSNLKIQVKIPAINPQACHLQSHQWIILTILALNHYMYQARISPYLQLLYQ